MAGRYELANWQWHLIEDLFPPPKPTGRKRSDPRLMLNAIFWVLCSGATWRDLPERYGPYQTAFHWFNTWSKDGTFDRILERLMLELNDEGLIDLDTWYADATNVRASRAAAGAKGGDAKR